MHQTEALPSCTKDSEVNDTVAVFSSWLAVYVDKCSD